MELERLEAQAAEAELPYSIDELKKLKKDQLKEVAASFAVENFESQHVRLSIIDVQLRTSEHRRCTAT